MIYMFTPTRLNALLLWAIVILVSVLGSVVFGMIDIYMYRKLRKFADRSKRFQLGASTCFMFVTFSLGF
jgi:hypothetical protein